MYRNEAINNAACFSLKSSSASAARSAIFLISITDILSDAESREEQDGCNQKFVRPTTAELWPLLWIHVTEKDEERFLLFV